MTVDGVALENLSCRMSGGGLGGMLGSLTIAAGFGQRKAELDRCATGGKTKTEVRWQQRGGKMSDLRATGADGKRNACVERALTGAPGPQDAECAAVVVHGR
ncbi:MAG: hypothetical protein JRI23_35155 [Deltaproteobacteria bacterium]|nr:hypothetical protein [Deltaproteobacteria bacterium]MBW2537552.1 hypothetical protein [Deltaproteobacteria bacterium]